MTPLKPAEFLFSTLEERLDIFLSTVTGHNSTSHGHQDALEHMIGSKSKQIVCCCIRETEHFVMHGFKELRQIVVFVDS